MIFVFNGDADGICSLQQLYLFERPATFPKLVTGVKRDTHLIEKLANINSSQITVLDIEIEKNQGALSRVLSQGCSVRWFDHHKSQNDFTVDHPNLECWIDTTSKTNTSLIVSRYLNNPYPLWAAVGLYGDNLHDVADEICSKSSINAGKMKILKELGQAINYNSYGFKIEDLYIHPAELWKRLCKFENPFEFLDNDHLGSTLLRQRTQDLTEALKIYRTQESVLILPSERWARRVIGEVSNYLAQQNPAKAHCVLLDNGRNGYMVSVRAPLESPQGAADLCLRFQTGGGRAGAAGINHLPKELYNEFIKQFKRVF